MIEEFPMAGDEDVSVGVRQAKDILNDSAKVLKPGGLSIHTTTMPFLLDNTQDIEVLGYEVVLLNEVFKRSGLEANYLTFLRKSQR